MGDSGQSAKDVKITIKGERGSVTGNTNCFGDFTIDGFAANETYTVVIEAPNYMRSELEVHTRVDVYMGDLTLVPC